MPQIQSSLTTAGPQIPMFNATQLGKAAGLAIHFADITDLLAAVGTASPVAGERGNIVNGQGIWRNNQPFTLASEPLGITRAWFNGASAALSHANTIVLPSGRTVILPNDTNVVIAVTSAPGSGVGAVGDLAVDFAANVTYVKTGSTTWGAPVTIFPGASGGSTTVPFATVIPLDGQKFMPPQATVGVLTFTAQTLASRVPGSTCYLKMTADGVVRAGPNGGPTFTGFKQYGTSQGWDNNLGVINDIEFFFDGTDAWYSIAQSSNADTLPTYRSSAVTGSTITATLSGPGITNVSLPAPSGFTLETRDSTNALVADSVTAVGSSVATAVQLTKSRALVAGDTTILSYVPPVTNPLVGAGGNLFAWTRAAVAASSFVLDLLGLSSSTAAGAWSTRKLRGGYTGPAVNIARFTSGGTAVGSAQDIGFTGGGDLDTSNSIFTSLGTDVLRINRMYNQAASGVNYDFVSFGGNGLLVLDSTINKWVARGINAGTSNLRISGQAGIPSTFLSDAGTKFQQSMHLVALPDTNNGGLQCVGAAFASVFPQIDSNGVVGRSTQGDVNLGNQNANWKQFSQINNGTNVLGRVQGAGITGVATGSSAASTQTYTGNDWGMLGITQGSGAGWRGSIAEYLQLGVPLAGTNLTLVEGNQRAYWGV